ncbi:MAG TPA: serine/threonine-protein kinase [Gemmataceae bacterium]|nr:serine/threonine-protein kinase [Gemmataceae bacterium]
MNDTTEKDPQLPPTEKVLPPGDPNATILDRPGQAAAPPTAANGSRTFGDYEIIAELGRGGMGVVYRVRQKSLNRVVALKMLLPGSLPTPADLQRFKTEAESTAGLRHRNIVTVHEVGDCDGCHFYSMDFIDGVSLAQRLSSGPLPGRVAARYVEAVARAIHHAHQHDILHRDLKPSNILIDRQDEPHVTDFGLAKRMHADKGQTRTGSILGTPGYMAPEQAAGRIKELGPATDVYGLGAVLYECLTGRPPFQAETPMDTMMQVLERDPAPPSLLNPNVDRDLETICLKCLEKDPANRYPSAEAVADDLRRYLDGESISASTVNVFEYLGRTLGRSQHMGEFRSWGNMLLLFAAIVSVEHLLIFVLTEELTEPSIVFLVVRTLQFALMGILFWRNRSRRLLPASTAERQLWSIWIGYLIGCAAVVLAGRYSEFIPKDDVFKMRQYVLWSLLAGMAFFVMGGSYWGRCYAFGLAFFGLAVLLPLKLALAPLGFGALWAVSLLSMGLHLRRLAAEAEAEAAPADSTPTERRPEGGG